MSKYHIIFINWMGIEESDCITASTAKQAVLELIKLHGSIRIIHIYNENSKEIPPKELLN